MENSIQDYVASPSRRIVMRLLVTIFIVEVYQCNSLHEISINNMFNQHY